MVITAVVQFGILYNHYMSLTDAVRSGARLAAVSRQQLNPVAAVKAATVTAGTDLGLDQSQVSVDSTWQAGTTVTVRATYPYTLSIFGIPLKSGSLTSATTERVE